METSDSLTGLEIILFVLMYVLFPGVCALLASSAGGWVWGVVAYIVAVICVFGCELMCR